VETFVVCNPSYPDSARLILYHSYDTPSNRSSWNSLLPLCPCIPCEPTHRSLTCKEIFHQCVTRSAPFLQVEDSPFFRLKHPQSSFSLLTPQRIMPLPYLSSPLIVTAGRHCPLFSPHDQRRQSILPVSMFSPLWSSLHGHTCELAFFLSLSPLANMRVWCHKSPHSPPSLLFTTRTTQDRYTSSICPFFPQELVRLGDSLGVHHFSLPSLCLSA